MPRIARYGHDRSPRAATRKAMPVIVPVRINILENEVIVESLIGDAVPLTAGSVVALESGTIGRRSPTRPCPLGCPAR